ncbi:MAG: OmpA family protein [Bacteroidetes bacterium]|nr:OmpA family protein [Bacteroidota bacterium]
MKKIVIYLISFICISLAFSNDLATQSPQYTGDPKGNSYRERLIDYADIYSYEVNPSTKDTILYVRKINDYWYGIFGTANFGLSFGNFKSLIDPKNDMNIFNTVVDFYSKVGSGYTFGLVGEWTRPTSDLSYGLKLGGFDRKITRIGADNVTYSDNAPIYLEGDHNFNANLTYLTFNPYLKYTFPQFDGFFVTGGADVSFAYSSVAYLQRNFENTGNIYHKINIEDLKGKPRFLINLGVGYDFFIADFFSAKNRVRITPFADLKGGTHIITSRGSNWNDVVLNIGLQIKLAPDKIKIDTLYYDPNSEIPVNYMADIRNETGFEFPGFKELKEPPSFDLAYVPEPEPDPIMINIPTQVTPPVPTGSPIVALMQGTTYDLDGYATENSTSLTQELREKLDEIAIYLKNNPRVTLRIDGHSDDRGTGKQNMDRATARANAVVRYLVSQGVQRGRLLDQGRGSLFPKATNNTAAGRLQNRRVSITVQ